MAIESINTELSHDMRKINERRMDGPSTRRGEDLADPLELPVLAGVFLLKSARNARFINRMVPGACIPDHLIERLDQAKDPMAEGIAIAAEQVRQFTGIAQGMHLMAVKAEQRIPEVLDRAGVSLPLM